jgi:hypothetical protein
MLSKFVLFICLPVAAMAQQDQISPGRLPFQPEFALRTGETIALCLRQDPQIVSFCNGLVQGYAEYAVLSGKVCIPPGTGWRDLVDVFTAPEVVVTTGYIDNLPALETALEMFISRYPCN